MKKIVIILIAMVAMQVTAQDKKRDHQRDGQRAQMESMRDLSPEEIATLQTKKMTLHLDLNEAQQKKVETLFLEEAKLRKTKMEERKAMKDSSEKKQFTKEDKFKMMNERLDHQIEMKQKMKSILNDEQFEKWEISQGNMEHRRGGPEKMKKNKMNKEKSKQ